MNKIENKKLDLEKIKSSNTKWLGKNIKYFEKINSTQDYAKENLQNLENGTIIISDKQEKGKGTKGSTWYSGENTNITMTLIIKKDIELIKIKDLTVDIAKIIQLSINQLYGYELQIKKPNDLLLNNKKICGILTESKVMKEEVSSIIIGTGINVNDTEFSEEVKDIATSLKREYSKTHNREEIINKILENLENYIEDNLLSL